MRRPWISLSWWDWGGSGPQRRWEWPSSRKRVSAGMRVGPVNFEIGRSYIDGWFFIGLWFKRRPVVLYRKEKR